MFRIHSSWLIGVLLTIGSGCATQSGDMASSGCQGTCYVCKYNNDLACVNVKVKDSTPKAEYNGSTYYFCSDSCRQEFLKKPDRYGKRP